MKTQPLSHRIIFMILLTACLLTMRGESNSGIGRQSSNSVYNGIWKGQCKGRVFVILTLNPDEGGSLKGTIAVGDIRVDENGEVNEVTGEAKDAVPISDVNFNQEALTFRAKSGNDLLSYRMRAVSTNKATLQIEGAPPEVKPFTLQRGPENQ